MCGRGGGAGARKRNKYSLICGEGGEGWVGAFLCFTAPLSLPHKIDFLAFFVGDPFRFRWHLSGERIDIFRTFGVWV